MSAEIPLADWESVMERTCRTELQIPTAAQFPSLGGLHSFTSVTTQKDLHTGAHIRNKNLHYADLPHIM